VPAVSIAGAFHSAYGTERYPLRLWDPSRRTELREVLGLDAERLVYLFCAARLPSVHHAATLSGDRRVVALRSGATALVSEAELSGLLMLSWANRMEQTPVDEAHLLRPSPAERALLTSEALSAIDARTEPPAGVPTLARLLGTGEAEAQSFLGRFPHEVAFSSGSVDRFDGLASMPLVELLRLPRAAARSFHRRGNPGFFGVPTGHEMALFDHGFTLYLHHVRSPSIDRCTAALGRELGAIPGRTRASLFASRKGPGVPWHRDENHNFVCQLVGQKSWRLGKRDDQSRHGVTSFASPDPQELAEPANVDTLTLREGDVLFVPSGTHHTCETTTDHSVHVNFQVALPTWRELIVQALRSTSWWRDGSLDASVARAFVGDVVRPDVRARLSEILEAMPVTQCLDGLRPDALLALVDENAAPK